MLHFIVLASGENAALLEQRVRAAGATITTANSEEEVTKLLSYVSQGLLMSVDGVVIEHSFNQVDCGHLPCHHSSADDREGLVAFVSSIQQSHERESTLDEPMLEGLRLRWIARAGEHAERLRSFGELYSADDLQEARRIAHTIRGTAESFGFGGVGVVATSLEEAIKGGENPATLKTKTEDLLRALDEIAP